RATRALAPTASHCPEQPVETRKCRQPFQPSFGPRSRTEAVHFFGCLVSIATGLRAISSVAPPLQACANSTTAPCGTSASRVLRSKRRAVGSSLTPPKQGRDEGRGRDCPPAQRGRG